jgi:ketosteroid isomerase-like protein
MTDTMTSAQLITSVYDAFKRGDIPHILSLVGPDAIWRQSKMLPWGGDYRGPQGAAEFFQKLDGSMETVSLEVHENIDQGDEVFSFGVYTGRSRKTGRTASAEWMFRWRVQGGKITSYESYTDSAALLAALNQ